MTTYGRRSSQMSDLLLKSRLVALAIVSYEHQSYFR